jgi:2-polyprenyl-6-methoxyphenol hydroxylase-like FAD-dependent oxidoreductase
LGPHGWSPTHLPSYDILSVSRPVLEFLVRRRVLEIPGVSLRDGFRVSGLGQTADGWEISGSTGETVLGDMVVDASGRGSRLPQWLAELGYSVPKPESVEAKLGYASRRYQGPEAPPFETGLVIVATPESPVGPRSCRSRTGSGLCSRPATASGDPPETPAGSPTSSPPYATGQPPIW